MLPESVAKPDSTARKCMCGYIVRVKDLFWVQEYGVWHAICHRCGDEFVI